MAFKVISAIGTGLHADASLTSDLIVAISPNVILKFLGEKKQNDTFLKVAFTPHPGTVLTGWVLAAHCQEVPDGPRPPVVTAGFIRACLLVERDFNDQPTTKPWFVNADFVIARAVIETEITNSEPKVAGSDGIGPLQVTSAEWQMFLEKAGTMAAEFTPTQRDNSEIQIYGAAYRMQVDAKEVSKVQKDAGVGTDTDPFLPSYLDLFHAYLFNPTGTDSTAAAKAAVAILNAEKTDAGKAKTVKDVLTGVLDVAKMDAVFAARGAFVGTAAAPETVAEFVAGTEAKLKDGFVKALDFIKEIAPEELPQLTDDEAPWYDKALTLQGLEEHKPADAATIKKFFEDTTFGSVSASAAVPHWCGAFVAHCMAHCDSDVAKNSIPKGAAVAANWKGWGDPINFQSADIPVGAVVVLSPSDGTGTSGHVALFSKRLDDNRIELLGGNQGDKSGLKAFSASKIAYVGWLNLAPTSTVPGGTPSSTGIAQKAIDLIVASEVTSRARYDALYHKPTWPEGNSGVTIGIGYDVGHTTPAKLDADWNGRLSASTINRLKDACGRTGASAEALARKMAAEGIDVPWDHAMAVFLTRDIPAWVGTVERALPNTNKLSKKCLGALVSLAYNRGASFSKAGERYIQMRNIKTHMTNQQFAKIPQEFRDMKPLWPDLRGLQIRRDAEADLFQAGLADAPGA